MFPLIRSRSDHVTVCPLTGCPEIGDIVLFADPERGRYVLHRVWQIEGEQILTWGDNCPASDGWMPLNRLWGKTVLIERGHRRIRPERKAGLRLARAWHRVGWVWRLAGRCRRAAARMIGRLISRAER